MGMVIVRIVGNTKPTNFIMRTSNVNQPTANRFTRKARITGAVMLSAFCLVGMTSCEDDDNDPILETINQQDRNFAMSSSAFVNAQVSLGQLALVNGEDDSILEYGRMLVDDNTASQAELEGIVEGKEVELSGGVSAEMQAKLAELTLLTGVDFDKAFIRAQIEILNDSMSMFENEIDNGENFTIKGYADKTLGQVKDHKAAAVLVKAEVDIEDL
jgi:predicted outer membrane protein